MSGDGDVFTFLCTIFGALIHYFLLSNFFWCFCIAFNFYQMIVKRNSGTRALEKYYHLIGWGTPCIAVIVVASFFKYGQTAPINGTCYIRDNVLVFATFFSPRTNFNFGKCSFIFFRCVGNSRNSVESAGLGTAGKNEGIPGINVYFCNCGIILDFRIFEFYFKLFAGRQIHHFGVDDYFHSITGIFYFCCVLFEQKSAT